MVASLAAADMIGGLGPYVSLAGLFSSGSPSVWIPVCYVELSVNVFSAFGNMYNMLLVTVDRYVYLTWPLRYEQFFTPSNGLIAIIITWVFLTVQMLTTLIFGSSVDMNLPCGIIAARKKDSAVFAFQPIIMFIMTISLILPAYIRIGLLVRKLQKNEPHLSMFPPEAQAAQRKKLKERKMAKTMGLVLGVYLGAWASVVSATILNALYKSPYPFGIVLLIRFFRIIYWMQSVLNPFLYGRRNKTFAKYYRKILRLKPSQIDMIM